MCQRSLIPQQARPGTQKISLPPKKKSQNPETKNDIKPRNQNRKKSSINPKSQNRKKEKKNSKIKENPEGRIERVMENGKVEGLEFRSYPDDAWYSVRVVAEDKALRIKYCGFGDDSDTVFRVSEFKDLKDVTNFASRFRPVSLQLQDCECSNLHIQGLLVCAAHCFKDDDLRFYDAIVEGVDHCEHSFANGEEECLCTFILSWLHGPNAGNITAENIGHICKVQVTEEIHPVVASFLKTVREKLVVASSNSNSEVTTAITHNDHGEVPPLRIGHKLSFSHHLKQVTKSTKWFLSDTLSSKYAVGYPCEKTGQEIDFGGVGNYFLIFVENLEKDLTPLAIMKFIWEKVSIASQAFIFPSLSSEIYMRGNILLDSKSKFEKLCDFLENPDQIIVSSGGRPWVITGKMKVHDTLRASLETLSLISQRRDIGSTNELKVVHSGTDEYQLAKELSNLYKELSDHQKKLQKRLLVDEGIIWQQYNAKRRIIS